MEEVTLRPIRLRDYTLNSFRDIPQVARLSEVIKFDIDVVHRDMPLPHHYPEIAAGSGSSSRGG